METLENNLKHVRMRRAGIVATMEAIDVIKAKSLRKPEDFGLHELRACYAMPTPYDFNRANSEISRLDWIIGLIEKDIKARDRKAKSLTG